MQVLRISPKRKEKSTCILFHGMYRSGDFLKSQLERRCPSFFQSPNIKYILPTAPLQNFSLANGQPKRVWMNVTQRIAPDLDRIENHMPFDREQPTMDDLCRDLVDSENLRENELPLFLMGHSMGGYIATHLALEYLPKIGVKTDRLLLSSTFISYKSTCWAYMNSDDCNDTPCR